MAIEDEPRASDGGPLTRTHIPVLILPASLRDLFAVRALETACFGSDAWSYLEILPALTMPGVARFKAVVDDRLVGLVIGEPRPFEGTGWIETIGVLPAYQRHRIGERLLAACEEALTQPVIKLTVRASNSPAIALYAKRGYRRVDIWKGYYADGEDGLIMEKHK